MGCGRIGNTWQTSSLSVSPLTLYPSLFRDQDATSGADGAAYDVFELTWFEEPIKCVAGLIAAFISTSKIYDSQWIASQGK